jgi:hypothetical protein
MVEHDVRTSARRSRKRVARRAGERTQYQTHQPPLQVHAERGRPHWHSCRDAEIDSTKSITANNCVRHCGTISQSVRTLPRSPEPPPCCKYALRNSMRCTRGCKRVTVTRYRRLIVEGCTYWPDCFSIGPSQRGLSRISVTTAQTSATRITRSYPRSALGTLDCSRRLLRSCRISAPQ